MLVNENRLNLADARARQYLARQMEQFFFGDGADKPAGYVPPAPELTGRLRHPCVRTRALDRNNSRSHVYSRIIRLRSRHVRSSPLPPWPSPALSALPAPRRRTRCSTCTRPATTRPTRRCTPTSPRPPASDQPRRRRRRRHPGAAAKRRRASPADVILLVDAARLWRAEVDGLFQPVKIARCSTTRIPARCAARTTARARSGSASRPARASSSTTRPRCKRDDVDTYEELADPQATRARSARARARIRTTCRCSAPLLEHLGPQKTEAWLQGHGRQHGARAQGWRHRPDQGGGQRRMRHRV